MIAWMIAMLLVRSCSPMVGGHCYYNADPGVPVPCEW